MTATSSANSRVPVSEDHLLPLALLELPADNPRRRIGDVTELASSIDAVGLLEPIVVTPRKKGGYLVVCGSRRFAAATQLGLEMVPVLVREFDERERREAMLIENLQREDLTVLEEAEAFQALVELGLPQRELAGRLGRSQSHLSKRIALLKLPEAARKALDSGGITLEDAQELLKLSGMPKRMQRAWSDGRNGSILHCVRMQLEEHKIAETIGRETERLKKAGVRILQPGKDTYGQKLPKGTIEISKDGGYDQLTLDPKKHQAEPCHAAVIMNRYGTVKILYLCTDRQRHPDLKTSSERYSNRNTDDQKKEREKQRRQREAAKQRTEFIQTLLTGRPRGADPIQRLVCGFLEVSQQDVLKVACDLLGLEASTEKRSYGATYRDYKRPIAELAAGGSSQLRRVALALGLAATEARMELQWTQWGDRERAHLEFLTGQGYEPSAAERARLPRQRGKAVRNRTAAEARDER